jgi:hypothetical protein
MGSSDAPVRDSKYRCGVPDGDGTIIDHRKLRPPFQRPEQRRTGLQFRSGFRRCIAAPRQTTAVFNW